ncbi:hypothetical protein BSKO_06110 [Bryopsis sp. KO-2023]|nr:hypothetical protein BSKO_06110 [Bryopsis sp. KO-2023]
MGPRATQAARNVRLTLIIAGITIVAHVVLFWQSSMLTRVPGFTMHPQGFENRLFTSITDVKSKIDALVEGSEDSVSKDGLEKIGMDLGRVLNDWSRSGGPVLSENNKEASYSSQKDLPVVTSSSHIEDKIRAVIDRSIGGVDLGLGVRPKIKVFVGVFTGFNDPGRQAKTSDADKYDYKKRRKALRETWFPGTKEERDRLEKEKGIVVRFVVGHSADPKQEEVMGEEEKANEDFIRIPLTESYYGLTNKTKNFFTTAAALYDAEWYVKVDDDVYLMVERILLAAKQWAKMGAGYIGCMKHGYVWKEENTRWFEPQHLLLGNEYYLHAYGSIYVMSKRTVEDVIVRNFNNLRYFANEDTTVGSWMLGHNVTHFEDMRLCATHCSGKAVGILRNECAGLCDPLKDLYLVHNARSCRFPAEDPLPYMPSYPDHTAFEKMRV